MRGAPILAAFLVACSKRCSNPAKPVEDVRVVVEAPDTCVSIEADFESRRKDWCSDNAMCRDMVPVDEKKDDLNGDGAPEVARTVSYGAKGLRTDIYLGGSPCAVHLIDFDTGYTIATTRHGNWADIQVADFSPYCDGNNECNCVPATLVYAYDGVGYSEVRSQRVEGRNGHCPQAGDPCKTNDDCTSIVSSLTCIDASCADFNPGYPLQPYVPSDR